MATRCSLMGGTITEKKWRSRPSALLSNFDSRQRARINDRIDRGSVPNNDVSFTGNQNLRMITHTITNTLPSRGESMN